jgi:hypothetical protein
MQSHRAYLPNSRIIPPQSATGQPSDPSPSTSGSQSPTRQVLPQAQTIGTSSILWRVTAPEIVQWFWRVNSEIREPRRRRAPRFEIRRGQTQYSAPSLISLVGDSNFPLVCAVSCGREKCFWKWTVGWAFPFGGSHFRCLISQALAFGLGPALALLRREYHASPSSSPEGAPARKRWPRVRRSARARIAERTGRRRSSCATRICR